MRNYFYLTLGCLLFFVQLTRAQTDFQQTDSVSTALYTASKWNELISFGKNAIAKGDDFPILRLRIAFAAFQLEKYSMAMQNYEQVLATDKYNQTALYYSYLCNIYLNRPKEASFLISYVDGKSVDGLLIKPTYLTVVGAETSLKFTDNLDRGNSNYARIFAQLRASYQFYIDYSVQLYNQQVVQADHINQAGNHLKLSYTPFKNLGFIAAWNYSNASYLQTNNESNTLLFGVKYSKPYFQLQADASLTKMRNANAQQNNLQLLTYLSGNLNLYLNNRVSYLATTTANGADLRSFIYSPSLGFKVKKSLWAELGTTFGEQYNYAEADGLYQYNGLDLTTFKFSSNAYFLFKKHLLLSLGYNLEQKRDEILKFNYLQHSINAGITWNF